LTTHGGVVDARLALHDEQDAVVGGLGLFQGPL
jgi:hypothetical protein